MQKEPRPSFSSTNEGGRTRQTVYLDHASSTPPYEEVLSFYELLCKENYANANSTHFLGEASHNRGIEAEKEVLKALGLSEEEYEVVFTSSATEANNLALHGLAESYLGRNNHFACSELEHPSVQAPLMKLKESGARLSIIPTTEEGTIDLKELSSLDDLLCLSLVAIDGELGFLQPIQDAAKIVHEKGGYIHVDATQAIGKFDLDYKGIDLISFSGHKFGSIPGSGALVKRKEIILSPLFQGGKSLSEYRPGTPDVASSAALARALTISKENLETHFEHCKAIKEYALLLLKDLPITINSNPKNPYILNISSEIEGREIVRGFASKGICLSHKSACSIDITPSKPIMAVYHDKKRAKTSFRLSFSFLNTKEDIEAFVSAFEEILHG